ncbi:MAG: hypothetical protein FWH12_05835 [Treponema sp.]|nr:hypothetical protein [Treponema sp.]
MERFDLSKDWVLLLPTDIPHVKKASEDLSRCLGLLLGREANKGPIILEPSSPLVCDEQAHVHLASDGEGPEHRGYSWRVGTDRVEIRGESGRGLCNGIYSFLGALGFSWPSPGEERIPQSKGSLAQTRIHDSSHPGGFHPPGDPALVPPLGKLRRYLPAGKKELRKIVSQGEVFFFWAARQGWDALVLPLAACLSLGRRKIEQLKKAAGEFGISCEAGGHELSLLVPKRNFLFHGDFFRMEEGRRKKDHHFCPTSLGVISLIKKRGEQVLKKAGELGVYHFWPDRGAEKIWCSCPACRAFSPLEQYRMALNAAADVLTGVYPRARLSCPEEEGECNIGMRKNMFRMERPSL